MAANHGLDHLVVLMFENRSFDHLLGYLYSPGERPSFEGVGSSPRTNVLHSQGTAPANDVIQSHPAGRSSIPYPDPGEEYPHVNTQLFGTVSPAENRFSDIDDMKAPFNAPDGPLPPAPPMSGFVDDYYNAFQIQMRRPPRPDELAQIMACYQPGDLPVLSTLAREFLCFDHWFCEVPSQTYPNRSFFHAATSSGFVLNGPPGKFALKNDAETIFERLESAGKSWKVYFDPAQILSATALIHASRLDRFFATHFAGMGDFYADASLGQLPNYSFIEPNMFHPHTDMHPHSGARIAEDLRIPPPDTLIGGEELLAKVYNAIRSGSTEGGSNWGNTALLVTFDEHGGTFDHVPPPSSVPPDGKSQSGEMGFGFDRLGVRIPTILVSAWVQQGRVVSEIYQATSMIASLREWWSLGPALTRRDQGARSFVGLLDQPTPREPSQWPEVRPKEASLIGKVAERVEEVIEDAEIHFGRLERDLLGEALEWESVRNGVPPVGDARTAKHREADHHLERVKTIMFPQPIR